MNAKHPSAAHYARVEFFCGIESFRQLEEKISALTTEIERGDAFEVFIEALLNSSNQYQPKNVWPEQVIPLEVREKLGLSDTGKIGIDGVLEALSGELHAYQVKFRTGRPNLSWTEVSSFFGLTHSVDQRLLISNTSDLAKTILAQPHTYSILGHSLDSLTVSDFQRIQNWLEGKKAPRTERPLWEHQQEAVDSILEGLDHNNRVTAIMACGTGKTLVALRVAEMSAAKTILVLEPSLALIQQTIYEWIRDTNWDKIQFTAICSDKSVRKGQDDLRVDPATLDFPVHTSAEELKEWIGATEGEVRVIFSTYQSSQVVGEALQDRDIIDLGIFDEAHKTAGRKEAKFSYALTDDNVPMQNRLFLTATPRLYSSRKRNKEGDFSKTFSMDDESIYGPFVYELPFAQAAEKEIICSYKVFISVIATSDINREMLKSGETLIEGDAVRSLHVANQIALARAVEQCGASKVFTFHRTVKQAQEFTEDSPTGIRQHLEGYNAQHINGSMRVDIRKQLLESFRSSPKAIISNARCLTEGVNVPEVDMVAFMAPKRSPIDIIQATGRALRKGENREKDVGYILLPVLVEETTGETPEEAVQASSFDTVWEVLEALMTQDESLKITFKQMREDQGMKGAYDLNALEEFIRFDGPSISVEKLKSTIVAQAVQMLTETWDEKFGLLVKCMNETGAAMPPEGQIYEGINLGQWIITQRGLHKNGLLSEYRFQKLNGLKGWVWDHQNYIDEKWEQMYQRLLAHYKKHGTSRVADTNRKRLTNDDELFRWVKQQRAYKLEDKQASDKAQKLEALHDWKWHIFDDQWWDYYDTLKKYCIKNDTVNLSRNLKIDGLPIFSWAANQKTNYRLGELSKERIELLEAIPKWVWNRNDSRWNMMFGLLQEYVNENGTAMIPTDEIYKNENLGYWVGRQRKWKKTGDTKNLTPTKEKKLESLKGWDWDPENTQWWALYNEVKEFAEREGHSRPSRNLIGKNGFSLGGWIHSRRHNYKKGMLSKDRIEALEKLPNWEWEIKGGRPK